MQQNVKISPYQFAVLVIFFVVGDSILFVISNVTIMANQAGWISALLAGIVALCLAYLYNLLIQQYPGLNLFEIIECVFGVWVGRLVIVYYLYWFMVNNGSIVNDIGGFMTTQIMPETPVEAILVLYLLIIIM
jgi:spore germination protein KB